MLPPALLPLCALLPPSLPSLQQRRFSIQVCCLSIRNLTRRRLSPKVPLLVLSQMPGMLRTRALDLDDLINLFVVLPLPHTLHPAQRVTIEVIEDAIDVLFD